jgi:hypothetical protein
VTDVANEPRLWRRFASGRDWTTAAGCLVRIDVIADYDGPSHCGFESSRRIVLGDRPGSRYTGFMDTLAYVRDPEDVLGDRETAAALDLDAWLPPGAAATDLRLERTQLWIASTTRPESIFLVTGAHVERWPLDPVPTACG